MFASNHVITGAVIGSLVVNPVIAIPVAFCAHFVLDAFPHYGIGDHTSKKFLYTLSADAGLALALIVVIFVLQPQNWLLIIACGVSCASPDLMWLPRWLVELKGRKPKNMGPVRRFHSKVQWAEREIWWGLTSEVAWFCLMIFVLANNLNFT
ncbi:hypothetical protein KDA00_01260 [Candidatus Saccharibacteria bacterium]|nr:hypothetical protein [Candidatus Saccharibacteria bacterium]